MTNTRLTFTGDGAKNLFPLDFASYEFNSVIVKVNGFTVPTQIEENFVVIHPTPAVGALIEVLLNVIDNTPVGCGGGGGDCPTIEQIADITIDPAEFATLFDEGVTRNGLAGGGGGDCPTIEQIANVTVDPMEFDTLFDQGVARNNLSRGELTNEQGEVVTQRFYIEGEIIRFAGQNTPLGFDSVAGSPDYFFDQSFLHAGNRLNLRGNLTVQHVRGSGFIMSIGNDLKDGVGATVVNKFSESNLEFVDSFAIPGVQGDGVQAVTLRAFAAAYNGADQSVYIYQNINGAAANGAAVTFSRFNAVGNTFTTLANPPTQRTNCALAEGNNGFIYMFGGLTDGGNTAVASVLRYQVSNNTWSTVSGATLPSYSGTKSRSVKTHAKRIGANEILVTYDNRWAIFQISTQTFTNNGLLPTGECNGLANTGVGQAVGLFNINSQRSGPWKLFQFENGVWTDMLVNVLTFGNTFDFDGDGGLESGVFGGLEVVGSNVALWTGFHFISLFTDDPATNNVRVSNYVYNLNYTPTAIRFIRRNSTPI